MDPSDLVPLQGINNLEIKSDSSLEELEEDEKVVVISGDSSSTEGWRTVTVIQDGISQFPGEILVAIFRFLPRQERFRLRLLCKKWRTLLMENFPGDNFSSQTVAVFDGKDVKYVNSDERNELGYNALFGFIKACERQHFGSLVFGSKRKGGLHLFSVIPKDPSENIVDQHQHQTEYCYVEEYLDILEFVPNKNELIKLFKPKKMAMVGFRLPFETSNKYYGHSVLNIHLYNIKSKARVTKTNRLRIDYFGDGISA